MRYVYLLLILLGAIAFVLGSIEKVWGAPPEWYPPLTLWRFAIGTLAFAIVFVLLDIRDHIVSKKKED
jgi:peptidoglycan/LPS O-acetylase OafA/YrhL